MPSSNKIKTLFLVQFILSLTFYLFFVNYIVPFSALIMGFILEFLYLYKL